LALFDGAEFEQLIATHLDDTEATLFPRSEQATGDARLILDLCLDDRAPLGLTDFFTGAVVALYEIGSVAICVTDLADGLALWSPSRMKDLQRWDLGPGVQVKAVECRPDKWVITADASESASCPECGRTSIGRHGTYTNCPEH